MGKLELKNQSPKSGDQHVRARFSRFTLARQICKVVVCGNPMNQMSNSILFAFQDTVLENLFIGSNKESEDHRALTYSSNPFRFDHNITREEDRAHEFFSTSQAGRRPTMEIESSPYNTLHHQAVQEDRLREDAVIRLQNESALSLYSHSWPGSTKPCPQNDSYNLRTAMVTDHVHLVDFLSLPQNQSNERSLQGTNSVEEIKLDLTMSTGASVLEKSCSPDDQLQAAHNVDQGVTLDLTMSTTRQ